MELTFLVSITRHRIVGSPRVTRHHRIPVNGHLSPVTGRQVVALGEAAD
jgi:hypothetical protein